MLHTNIIAVCSEIHTEHINSLCGQKAEFLKGKRGCRSQWSRAVRYSSAAACFLALRVRIPPGAWMSVSCECCVLSGSGLCDGPITRPEEY
jgi:hypothetical protein